VEFSTESLMEKYRDGYKPTSEWYVTICKCMNYHTNMITQELFAEYIIH
jgi:hypothetical protein